MRSSHVSTSTALSLSSIATLNIFVDCDCQTPVSIAKPVVGCLNSVKCFVHMVIKDDFRCALASLTVAELRRCLRQLPSRKSDCVDCLSHYLCDWQVVHHRFVAINQYFDALCGFEVMAAVCAVQLSSVGIVTHEFDTRCPWMTSNTSGRFVTRLNKLANSTLRDALKQIHPKGAPDMSR
ncbi:uncharacterized protein EDB91DRAFT_1093679 [Suillus paluster]|uniref:uncharacterized protein n=1 Tax=Suillus paluster TaxID=48578 RepID=UPI001B885660|nr:uncharacterized protein EDB91DRAFT_1093679 [Suillus paluster]KAG1756628.1 hypothetical protein EDB91DRAFT_1093679 [Suillus paluster]